MLAMPVGAGRFNVRVAGIALRDGHVLVHRMAGDAYWVLPGGRVEFGEDSATALSREMKEELGTDADVGRLVVFAENFFELDGRVFHELALFYEMDLPVGFQAEPGVAFWMEEEGRRYEFVWSRADEESLAGLPLLPLFLQPRLARLPKVPEHVIWRTQRGPSGPR